MKQGQLRKHASSVEVHSALWQCLQKNFKQARDALIWHVCCKHMHSAQPAVYDVHATASAYQTPSAARALSNSSKPKDGAAVQQ
jgi:hypothetical protein